MYRKIFLFQTCICLAIFSLWQGNLQVNYDKWGQILDKAAEAIERNYTLAELLDIGQEAADVFADIPAVMNEAVLSVNQESYFGTPMDENDDAVEKNVYAAAGGRVLRCGINDGKGMYVMIEHPSSPPFTGKISTYGQLSSIRVVSGERVKKGDILGVYQEDSGKDFYFTIEDKSGNSL